MVTLQTLKHIDALVSAEGPQSEANSEKVYEADEINVGIASLRRLKPSLYHKLLGPKLTIIGTKVYNGNDVDEMPGLRISFACAKLQLTNVEKKIIRLRDAFRDGNVQVAISRISAAFAPDCDCVALQDEFIFFDTRALNGNCRILVADDNIVELDDAAIANWLRFACEQVDAKLSFGGPNNESVDHNDADGTPAPVDDGGAMTPPSPIHIIEAGVNNGSVATREKATINTDQEQQMQEPTATDTNNTREAVVVDTHQLTGRSNIKHHKNKFYL